MKKQKKSFSEIDIIEINLSEPKIVLKNFYKKVKEKAQQINDDVIQLNYKNKENQDKKQKIKSFNELRRLDILVEDKIKIKLG